MENLDQVARKVFEMAYQVTGSVADAEDIRQEILLDWLMMEKDGRAQSIQNMEAYWVRSAANKSLNLLKKQNREVYPGPWLPEPLTDERSLIENRADLSYGFLHLLSLLNPAERAVFILRVSFDFAFKEIGEIVDASEESCRKLFQRAKEKLEDKSKAKPVTAETRQQMVVAFMTAIGTGDLNALTEILHSDLILYSDGGGKRLAALKPILGIVNCFKFLTGIAAKNQAEGIELRFELVDNGIDLMIKMYNAQTEELDTVTTFDFDESGIIRNVFLIRNPDKLTRVD